MHISMKNTKEMTDEQIARICQIAESFSISDKIQKQTRSKDNMSVEQKKDFKRLKKEYGEKGNN